MPWWIESVPFSFQYPGFDRVNIWNDEVKMAIRFQHAISKFEGLMQIAHMLDDKVHGYGIKEFLAFE